MIQEVEQYWDEDSEPTSKNKSKKTSKNTSKVFLVHGHDAGAKEEVARFITKLGLTPIILHEQPNQGKTIIEKFEQYADVSYAIVLFTPDDVGAAAGQSNSLNKRARQNVLLEFGFFLGQLGRDRVCGIVKDTIEVPTDYSGVIYIPFDSEGAWKFSLVKELKAARFSIDANSAF